MDEQSFQKLFREVKNGIFITSFRRDCITVKNKLIIALRYLTTSDSYRSHVYTFRDLENTIPLLVTQRCRAIYERLCLPILL